MSTKPSSNWLALQKRLVQPHKRRKIQHGASVSSKTSEFPRNAPSIPSRTDSNASNEHVDLDTTEMKNGESIAALRRMVLGKINYKASQTVPGKYLALDCEMVGVGVEGSESSLARVSIVNYTGAIVLDVFVRQREKVVDYRTQWSGVRSADLVGSAKPFKEVQQTVADLIKDRILVGHAIYNDLKALLLSHPSSQIRDTQSLAYKYRVVKSRRPALRVLVKQEFDLIIQGGEHNSVTDARATMALFRLYKKQWESGFRPLQTVASSRSKSKVGGNETAAPAQSSPPTTGSVSRRKRRHSESSKAEDVDEGLEVSRSSPTRDRSPSVSSTARARTLDMPPSPKRTQQKSRSQPPANTMQRKGISSGISTVTRRAGGIKEVRTKGKSKGSRTGEGSKGGKKTSGGEKWWKSLGGGKKSSMKF